MPEPESAAFPSPGDDGYDAWLDGPRPAEQPAQSRWMSGRSARARAERKAAKAAGGSAGAQTAGAGAQSAAPGAQSRMVALDEARGADVAALQAIIDGPASLNADRIRALDAKQRMLSAAAIEQASDVHSDLVALRDALLPLPEAERVAALTSVLRVQGAEGEGQSA